MDRRRVEARLVSEGEQVGCVTAGLRLLDHRTRWQLPWPGVQSVCPEPADLQAVHVGVAASLGDTVVCPCTVEEEGVAIVHTRTKDSVWGLL